MGRGNIDITYRTLRVDSINYKMLKKQDEYRNYSSSAAWHETWYQRYKPGVFWSILFLEIFIVGKGYFTWISSIIGTITCFLKKT